MTDNQVEKTANVVNLIKAIENCNSDEIASALACIQVTLSIPALCKFFKKYFAFENSEYPQETRKLFESLHGWREW